MKFLFILFLIFIVAPYLVRWLMPYLFRGFVKRAQNQMNQQFDQQNQAPKKEGEINIKTNPSKTKSSTEKEQLGDYVDYEEIKE